MDVKGAAVFLDFDGTITTDDTGLYVLERLAPDGWRDIERQYVDGAIGSRQCVAAQWRLLPRDRALVEAVTREVPLDPGLPALIDGLRRAGASVTILSDGFGHRAREVAREYALPVLANDVDWEAFEVTFSERDGSCPCGACGTCKRAPILAARRAGRTTILVGDGPSDVKAAEVADIVYAKDRLARWCRKAGIPHRRFTGLTDLAAQLGLDACPRAG